MSTPLDRADSTTAPTRPIGPLLLLVLALLSAVAPLGIDLYLPAFPEMAAELTTSATAIQLTLTAFLAGLTLGQLVFGALSDRHGRFRPLLVGAVLCVIASAVAVWAPSIGVLIAARFVQGFTGAAGMVIGRAIISDLAEGQAAARAFSLMMIVGAVAPVVAPFAGSTMVDTIGWRGILSVLCGLAVLMVIATVLVVRESHPVERRSAATDSNTTGLRVLRTRTFVGTTAAITFAFAVMMAYISASPFVYQVMIGMTPVQYGLAFGFNAVGISVVSAISARLSSSVDVRALLGTGLAVQFCATVVLLGVAVTHAPAWWLAIPIFFAVSSLGLVLGNGTALALSAVPGAAGTGSAVLGAVQFGFAAAISPLVSLGGENTALPLAIVMLTCSALAAVAFVLSRSETV